MKNNKIHKNIMNVEIPDDISQIGIESTHAIWVIAAQKFKTQLEQQAHHSQDKLQVAECTHEKLKDKIEQIDKINKQLKLEFEQIQRENKRLVMDLERKHGEVNNQSRHYERLEEKLLEREQEIRLLNSNYARTNEASQRLQKLLDDKNRQYELLQQEEREHSENLIISKRNQERLQIDVKQLAIELDQTREKNKKDYANSLANEVLVNELRDQTKKFEHEKQQQQSRLQDSEERFESEHNIRIKIEKKTELQIIQLETVNKTNRISMKKMEQDLTMAQSETQNLRNRMIRVDGAMERDKKEIERLESYLVSLVGNKKNYK